MRRYFVLLCLFSLTFSCAPTLKKQYIREMKGLARLDVPQEYDRHSPCNDKLNYIPDVEKLNHTPSRHIRINFHFMLSEKGEGNFKGEHGVNFAKNMLVGANMNLYKNKKMNLPPGNDTPVIPQRYKYIITPRPNVPGDDGIYFHYDDDLYWMVGKKGKDRNIFEKEVFEKYGVQKDTVLNIFVMANHPDSLKSPTFKVGNRGIAFGNWVKMGGWYNLCVDSKGNDILQGHYAVTKNLHHEIGHCLGLRHTWRGNDGCDDTPRNPGCWVKSKDAPCNVNWSNNVMDYNAYQSSWSPCQLGTAHYNMSKNGKTIRKLLKPTWCKLKKDYQVTIEEDIVWNGSKDIEGHIVIKDEASLTIRCRVALPKAAKIIVYPKGRLILDGATLENNCGALWKGIEVWTFGNDSGKVEFFNSPTIQNVENKITWVE